MTVPPAGRAPSGQHRRGFVTGLAALCAVTAVLPVAANAASVVAQAPPAVQAADSSPARAIAAFNDALLQIMKAGKTTSFRQRFDTLAPVVDRTFDLETILRNSVGLRWSGMPAAQRQQLLATFRRYTIATWVANFDAWSGQRFTVSPDVRRVGDALIVATHLVPRNGSPTVLSYVMRQTESGWRAVDVLVDGSISRVAVQRSDFSAVLSKGGAPALTASLQRKIDSMSDGSLA